MGRSFKDGLEGFLLDANTDGDIKFQIIEAKYGVTGFGIIVKIYQMIYRDCGYYCKWDELIALISAARWSGQRFPVTESEVCEIVDEAVKLGFFDKEMYKNHGILTSKGIQRRYFEVAKRRIKVDAEKEYLLLSAPDLPENVYINGKNVNRNPKNVDRNSTRNGMEVKEVKESLRERERLAPTLEDIKDFCRSEKLKISAEKFFYFYQAKGWEGIKDWKAKAREWDLREKPEAHKGQKASYAAYDLEAFEKALDEEDD